MPRPRFDRVSSVRGIASNLGCSVADLEELSSAEDQRPFYTCLKIPKRGKARRGQHRTVYQADQRLALIQKNLATWLSEYVQFPGCVQGFVNKRSTATNASVHLAKKRIVHADIKDFFDSIRLPEVESAFRAIGWAPPLAMLLARVSTLNGQLPQGASSSPCIANLVCRHLDTDMDTLAKASSCSYTRYADDITFSGDSLPSEPQLASILSAYGFRLRDGSYREQRRGKAQYVTGLTVSESSKPHIPRVAKRRLRLELHYAAKFGVDSHLERTGSPLKHEEELARLLGWINFIYSVEGSGRLFGQWLRVQARENT